MTTKEYLQQAYRFNELINSHVREIEQLRSVLYSNPSFDFTKERVKGKYDIDRIPKIVGKIADLEKQIDKEIDLLIDLKRDIHFTIETVENLNYKLLLRCRYIEFMTWEQIAERMKYSVRQVYRIHSEALQSVTIP